ncbi:interleukin-13 receptor subunit alpha-2-like [Brienomyrus brachyistius]|uniref:interleukin-13 receptor subunit alpha-2-like n=1 Tax=Brienomyrus brachyistius TaxID=42636 RepID=UPI0020B36549|nr:interleukin-13 receptor subunit alpha-2-like [Brienomyrus brachyistius]XP_048861233.1 interleukin-13 receptor subunit alpha-2-like [Brienomyrus brachyistius]
MIRVRYWTASILPLFLFIGNWNFCLGLSGFTIDPPADLHITDPGYLGWLRVGWALPSTLRNVTRCSVRFQLQYFNTYQDRWTTIRTTRLSFHAQFDLGKEVQVKVSTLLRGSCTNNSEILSPPSELVLQPPGGGNGPKIAGFGCIFHRKEFMECTWNETGEQPGPTQTSLFYWHKNMERALECPGYIFSGAERVGCGFPLDMLLEFSDFNILVNGSSSNRPLQPSYFSLQIQNLVKPSIIETLKVTAHPDRNVTVEWLPPEGRIYHSCLEFEVESQLDGIMERCITRELTCTFEASSRSETSCFRVRSRVHMFCADKGFWSDWSLPRCLSVPKITPDASALMKMVLACVLPVTILALLVAPLLLWTCRRTLKKRSCFLTPEKNMFTPFCGSPASSTEKLPFQLDKADVQLFQDGQSV